MKGFTLTETVIVIAIISILMGVLIPIMTDTFNEAKDDIKAIYNGLQVRYIDLQTNEEITVTDDYTLVETVYKDGVTILYFERKTNEENKTDN